MKRYWTTGLLTAVAAGGISLAQALPGSARVMKGQAPPDFSGTALDGRKVTLSELRGKGPVLLNFVANFAAPCKRLYAHLKETDEKLGAQGLKVIAVSQDEDRDAAAMLPKQSGARFPVLFDPKGAIAEKYDVQVLPHTVAIDREGKVQAVIVGADLAELDRAIALVMK